MTNQEAFNTVWNHFVVNQGPPSMDLGGSCRYRGPNGAKCAAGLLISDEDYRPRMEGRGIWCPEFEVLFTSDLLLLINSLQSAHDQAAGEAYFSVTGGSTELIQAYFSAEIKRRLNMVAIEFSLEVPL